MIKINLLPYKAEQRREQIIIHSVVLGVSVVIALAVCLVVHLALASKISDVESETVRVNAEIARLQKSLKEIENFRKLQDELKEKIDVLDQLKKNKSGPVFLLDDLNRLLPDKMWLLSFKESGGVITIEGIGLNEETVAVFLRDLEASDYFQGVVLIEITKQIKADNRVQKFKLECKREMPKSTPTAKNKGRK